MTCPYEGWFPLKQGFPASVRGRRGLLGHMEAHSADKDPAKLIFCHPRILLDVSLFVPRIFDCKAPSARAPETTRLKVNAEVILMAKNTDIKTEYSNALKQLWCPCQDVVDNTRQLSHDAASNKVIAVTSHRRQPELEVERKAQDGKLYRTVSDLASSSSYSSQHKRHRSHY